MSYKGRVVGTHRLDFVVDGKIVLELKAVSALTNVFKQQTLSYLKAAGLRLGWERSAIQVFIDVPDGKANRTYSIACRRRPGAINRMVRM